jgi:hypothetical protein
VLTLEEEYEFDDLKFLNLLFFSIHRIIKKYNKKYNFLGSMLRMHLYFYNISEVIIDKTNQHQILSNIENLEYFLIISNNSVKLKFTLIGDDDHTILTLTLGTISKYMDQEKKSLKKSHKTFVAFTNFIKRIVTSLLKKKKYIFMIKGLNKRVFQLINFFNFIFNKSNMVLFIIKPMYCFNKSIFKKLKSIKRKFQEKNTVRIGKIHHSLRLKPLINLNYF